MVGILVFQLHHPISDRLSIPCQGRGEKMEDSPAQPCGAIEIPKGITTSIEDSPGSLSSVSRELFHPEFQLPKVQGDVIRACLGISGLHPSNISNHVFPTCDSRFPTEAAMDAAYQLLPRSVFWGPKNQNHNFKTYHLVI